MAPPKAEKDGASVEPMQTGGSSPTKTTKEEDPRLKLSINQLCWARTAAKPKCTFWPAKVIDANTDEVKQLFRGKGHLLYAVRYIQDHSITFVTSLSCIKSWTQGLKDGSMDAGKSISFKKAVQAALEEFNDPEIKSLEDEYNARVNEVESEFPDPEEDEALEREDQSAKNRRKMKKGGKRSSIIPKAAIKRGPKMNKPNQSTSPPAVHGTVPLANTNTDDSDDDQSLPMKRSRTSSRPTSTERTQSEDREQQGAAVAFESRRAIRSRSRTHSVPPSIEPQEAVKYEVKTGAPQVLTDERVGFVGLNAVGRSILNSLLHKGNIPLVAVFDLDRDKALKFVDDSKKRGAKLRPKIPDLPNALFAECSIVFCCLSGNELNMLLKNGDQKTILQQLLENLDLVDGKPTNATKKGLVLLSPMERGVLDQTIADLAEADSWLEVLGVGMIGVNKDTTVYASGPQSLFDRCRGALSLIGSNIVYAGDSAVQALVCSTLMNRLSMGILKEVLATRSLAQQFGIGGAELGRLLIDQQRDHHWQNLINSGLSSNLETMDGALGLNEFGRWNLAATVLTSANDPEGPSKDLNVHTQLAQMLEHSRGDETVVKTLVKCIGLERK